MLLAADILEQRHVFLGRDVPARIDGHVVLRQPQPFFRLVVVKGERAVDRGEEIVGVVALEGKAAAGLIRFVVGPDRILEPARGVDDRDGAHAHRDELRQAAGLGLRRHEIHVAARIDTGGERRVEAQPDD